MRCLQHEAQRRAALLADPAPDALEKASSAAADKKELAQFDSPALEYLRESNLAAYEKMLTDMMAKIDTVLERS